MNDKGRGGKATTSLFFELRVVLSVLTLQIYRGDDTTRCVRRQGIYTLYKFDL